MDALPTSGVWQSYRRMPVESDYVVRGVDKSINVVDSVVNERLSGAWLWKRMVDYQQVISPDHREVCVF